MAFELYYSPYSTCSQKVRIGLYEKGAEWTGKLVDLASAEQLSPEYLAINPNGVVPALVHDGRPVIESTVILEYIDDVLPAPALAPAKPYERAQLRAWLRFFDEIPTNYIRYPSLQAAYIDIFLKQSREDFEKNYGNRPVRKYLYLKVGESGFPDSELVAAFDALRLTVVRVSAAVSESPWITGNEFSLAECAIIPVIDRLQDLGMDRLWADLEPLKSWWARCTERTSYSSTYTAGSRLSEYFPDLRLRAARMMDKLQARTGRQLLPPDNA